MHIEFVKLSNKGRYAVRALFEIAFYNDGKPTQVKDIAGAPAHPPRFLEQIFRGSQAVGHRRSKRGPQGGYSLSAPASRDSIGGLRAGTRRSDQFG